MARLAQDEVGAMRVGQSVLKVPQGLSDSQFQEVSSLIRKQVGHISNDIVVQGSRAGGTAVAKSDIDFGVRVPGEKFEQLAKQAYANPAAGTLESEKFFDALQKGIIHSERARLRPLEKTLQARLNMEVDISIIRLGGPFDTGSFIPLK